MCLHRVKEIHQEGEVTCYKLFITGDDGKLHSPIYFQTTWEIGETKTAEFPKRSGNNLIDEYSCISSGAFHSFRYKEDAAEYYHSNIDLVPFYRIRVAKCIIPEDNAYLYRGDVSMAYVGSALDGYASQKLKVVEILDSSEVFRIS